MPLLFAPLPSALFGSAVYAASEAPAPPDDPVRAQLLYEIRVFKESSSMMTSSALHGSLIDEYAGPFTDRIVAETTSIAQDANSTPSRLARALKYIRLSQKDFFDKGMPNTSYILIKMSSYFILHFPVSDQPGGYSQEKVDAFVDKMSSLRERLHAGEDGYAIYREFIEADLYFHDHPNP
ncbi:hypothetical protein [Saccharibacillus alkalitolerans]|uniref:Uncharacterized protein n=1 Tax=Saccharibacillus alkalitolerans TaxID=2705290 RepID=A0ABX0F062_9BACL|nr:hypothetical protein [Saccharibacillus alkalitolerans]NGZ74378.1 hypothetical protein [Saccharibacillus alkalitolerans]